MLRTVEVRQPLLLFPFKVVELDEKKWLAYLTQKMIFDKAESASPMNGPHGLYIDR